MYPSKSMVDYFTDSNKLFMKGNENDLQPPYNMASPFNQSTVNRSSSSTDSTSPESFPDFPPFHHEHRPFESARPMYEPAPRMFDSPRTTYEPQRYLRESPRPLHETPRAYESPIHQSKLYDSVRPICDTPRPESHHFMRRQRPIVGRKFMIPDNFVESSMVTPITKIPEEFEFPQSVWHDDAMLQRTPPNKSFVEPKHNFYELFPMENKGYEFKTPIKTNISPTLSNVSSSKSNTSLSFSNVSPNIFSPTRSNFSPPSTNVFVPLNSSPVPATSVQFHHEIKPGRMCTFCRKNGETPLVYMDHCVRERSGNKNIVTCPILRSHVCSVCGATGDNAHTITYCPVLRSSNNGLPLQSTTITLKNTRIKSNGRRRY